MSLRTLAIGCPRWPVVAADLPPHTPAAVCFANRVVVASAEAAGWGVRKGMRRREAQARCPDLEIVPYDPAHEARRFEPVVETVERFAPKVEVIRPGLCVTAARSPARYAGGEEALRLEVARAVDETIVRGRSHSLHHDDHARAGVADGPFAAVHAAVRGFIVPPGKTPDFLAPLPVHVLGETAPCDLFVRLGIRTLGDLAALDRRRVVARFGLEGWVAHRLACGDDDQLLGGREVPPDLTVVRELDPPARRVDVAMFAAKAAADELACRLAEHGLACAKLAIEVETEHGEERTRVWRYSSAFTPGTIAERVRWQLEGWLDDPPTGGIAVLRLRPEDVGPARGIPASLWSRRSAISDRVRRAVARVQARLGPRGALQAALEGGRHPSEQVRHTPWGDPLEALRPGLPGTATVTGPAGRELPPWPGRLPPPSPALVWQERRRVEVAADSGEPVRVNRRFAMSAPPATVHLDGRPLGVEAWAGPWPVDERWWERGRRCVRLQVVLSDGNAHLLVLEGGVWWLEATYD